MSILRRPLVTWDLETDQTVDGVRYHGVPTFVVNRRRQPILAIMIQTIKADSARTVWKQLHHGSGGVNLLVDEGGSVRSLVADRHAPALKGITNLMDTVSILSVGIVETADGVSDDQILAAASLIYQLADIYDVDMDNIISHSAIASGPTACSCSDVTESVLSLLRDKEDE